MSRSRLEAGAATAVNRGPGSRPTDAGTADGAIAAHLARWVEAGLASEDQAQAILVFEERCRAPVPDVAAERRVAGAAPVVPVVAEALGYLGATLAVTGIVLVLSRSWPDLPVAARLGITGAVAAATLAAGALVHERTASPLARLQAVVWLTSAAATAMFARALAADALDLDTAAVVAVCSFAVGLHSALLWRRRDRPVQQLSLLAAVGTFPGALAAVLAGSGPVGAVAWATGATIVAAGLAHLTPRPPLTIAAGALTAITGAAIATNDWQGLGLALGVATALALATLAVAPGPARSTADQLTIGALGTIALLQSAPGAITYFGRDAATVTGLAIYATGAILVLAGARRVVRLPRLIESVGATALVGGSALTGAQSPGVATLLGLVTATGLIVAGTCAPPAHVPLSVIGSLGLLVNVPWAINWYFPGEDRAPLLILATGASLLAIAVLVARPHHRHRTRPSHRTRTRRHPHRPTPA